MHWDVEFLSAKRGSVGSRVGDDGLCHKVWGRGAPRPVFPRIWFSAGTPDAEDDLTDLIDVRDKGCQMGAFRCAGVSDGGTELSKTSEGAILMTQSTPPYKPQQ